MQQQQLLCSVLATVGLLLALACQTVAASSANDLSWRLYKQRLGKSYSDSSEDSMRKELFLRNKALVEEHNSNLEQSNFTFTRELNKYADWTFEEMQILNGLRNRKGEIHHGLAINAEQLLEKLKQDKKTINRIGRKLPGGWDYSDDINRVSPVQDQGKCGSDWAFATLALIESLEVGAGLITDLSAGVIKLSEQNLVDCSTMNHGCEGGNVLDAMLDIEKSGIEGAATYPYLGKRGECQYDKDEKVLSIYDSYPPSNMNETLLHGFLESWGPQTSSLDGTNLHLYKGGFFNDCKSGNNNHAVLITGWGVDPIEGPFWMVRNSWGADWGENGYFRIARGKGMCGIGADVVLTTIL